MNNYTNTPPTEPFNFMFGYWIDINNPAHNYKGFPKHALVEILAHLSNRCRDRCLRGVHYSSTLDFKDARRFNISNSLQRDQINHADVYEMEPLYIRFDVSLTNSITLELKKYQKYNSLELYYFTEFKHFYKTTKFNTIESQHPSTTDLVITTRATKHTLKHKLLNLWYRCKPKH